MNSLVQRCFCSAANFLPHDLFTSFFLICSLATLLGTLIQMLVKANFTWQQLKAFRLVEMKDKLLKFKLNRKVI